MYQIKAIIYPKDPEFPERKYKRKYTHGIYIPKGKQTKKSKIQEDVVEFLLKNLKVSSDDNHLTFEVVVTYIQKIKQEFILKEE